MNKKAPVHAGGQSVLRCPLLFRHSLAKFERYREWKETNAKENKGKGKKGNEEKAA